MKVINYLLPITEALFSLVSLLLGSIYYKDYFTDVTVSKEDESICELISIFNLLSAVTSFCKNFIIVFFKVEFPVFWYIIYGSVFHFMITPFIFVTLYSNSTCSGMPSTLLTLQSAFFYGSVYSSILIYIIKIFNSLTTASDEMQRLFLGYERREQQNNEYRELDRLNV